MHTQTPGKFLHVIARSEATWQSASPAAAQNEKQYFGRIRKALRICPRQHTLAHADTCQIFACHCEERSDGTIRSPRGSAKQKATIPGESGKCYEFALSTTDLPGFSARTRIAAPVCALVRNDNRGAWVRIRPKYCQVAGFPCGENGLPHQCAHWFAMTCRRKDVCAGARTRRAMTC